MNVYIKSLSCSRWRGGSPGAAFGLQDESYIMRGVYAVLCCLRSPWLWSYLVGEGLEVPVFLCLAWE